MQYGALLLQFFIDNHNKSQDLSILAYHYIFLIINLFFRIESMHSTTT